MEMWLNWAVDAAVIGPMHRPLVSRSTLAFDDPCRAFPFLTWGGAEGAEGAL